MHRVDRRKKQDIIEDIRKHFKSIGITQTSYARQCGVNQSTISRIMSGKSFRGNDSVALEKICNYAGIEIYLPKKKDIMNNTELINALNSVWDGSEQHSKKLTKFIIELGKLTSD